MSFFVTRPPVPVPGIEFGSTPCSDAIRATTGETKVRPLPEAGAAGAAATGGGVGAVGWAVSFAAASEASAASCVAGSGGASGAGAAGAAPSGAITASTVPTSTVSPSWTRIWTTTPSAGLGTSVSTLSVEISSNGSSRPICSPSDLSHFVIVPSETDTPIWGMTTSVCVPVDICSPSTPPAL
jgi:hypothetical protein